MTPSTAGRTIGLVTVLLAVTWVGATLFARSPEVAGRVDVADDRWTRAAAESHARLLTLYRNDRAGDGWPGLFRLRSPAGLVDRFKPTYWWQAQALDALVDAQERAPTADGLRRMRALVRGQRAANRGRLRNAYYDDMAWMALALLRADAVGAGGAADARRLWRVIRAGWNETWGGGIPWRLGQPTYKNVATNGPAAILAVRLHGRDGRAEDLVWAKRIVRWLETRLVDAHTGVVVDGIDRRGDGRLEPDWQFSYAYGVALGAELELYRATGEPARLARARRIAATAIERVAPGGILADEGAGDAALFKGIFARHLAELDDPAACAVLRASALTAWKHRDAEGRFGRDPRRTPADGASLSAMLSGTMLMERMAAIERAGRMTSCGG